FVAFQNFNRDTRVKSQYLVVRSNNGGATWSQPVKAAEVHDGFTKYPVCEGSQVLDDMCARVNGAGNIDVDPRNGDLYLTWSDNRNGTAEDTNTDVFVKKSVDGGRSWQMMARKFTIKSNDDQWFPWLSVAPNGTVAVTYFDRRYGNGKFIDTSLSQSVRGGRAFDTKRVSEVSWNPDLAFRLGVFIGDYNGLDTTATTALPFWTDARFAEPNVRGNNPPRQQSDVMVDVEKLRQR
ncbi:MAG: exo-alpha-sialidase, partial [Actinobacteria bacterium]|nr:exo-alpha-sialidase [Actinomycetota bacterium]